MRTAGRACVAARREGAGSFTSDAQRRSAHPSRVERPSACETMTGITVAQFFRPRAQSFARVVPEPSVPLARHLLPRRAFSKLPTIALGLLISLSQIISGDPIDDPWRGWIDDGRRAAAATESKDD